MKVAEQFLLSLSLCRYPLSFEVVGLPDATVVQIVCSQGDQAQVRQQLEAYFSDAMVMEGDGAMKRAWERPSGDGESGGETVVAEFGLSEEFVLPLASAKDIPVDPLVGVAGALADVGSGEVAILQIMFRPVRHAWAESVLRSVSFADGSEVFDATTPYLALAKEKVSRPLYAVVLRVACRSEQDGRAWELARSLTGALSPMSHHSAPGTPGSGNQLIALDNEDCDPNEHAQDVVQRRSRRSGMILNSHELVAFVHPPSKEVRSPRLRREVGRTKLAPSAVQSGPGALVLGKNQHGGQVRAVSLTPDQRVRHMHVIGASGTGKSTFLLNLILQDIRRGEGVGVIDPHGDLIEAILDRIPENRIKDVVLLDPADEEYSIGFNILAAHSDTEKNLLASDLVAVFRRLSTSWGDQMNAVLANAVLAILESDRGGTLADLQRLLVEKPFREEFLESVQDEQVVYYWRKEFPFLTGRPQGPVLTRLNSFLRPKSIRYMVCQKENKLDFSHMMDSNKIFLARLSHGAIGEENAHLLGAFLVSKFHQTAMARQQTAEKLRHPFWLYVDEFQHFATPSMAALLSSVRKYRLGLVLAHQELHQLENRSPEVASAVLSNAYSRVCFRLGDHDAKKLGEGFGSFDSAALQNLGVGEAICRIERKDFDFNLLTPPAPPINEDTSATLREQVIAHSRQMYAVPREMIEGQLKKRSEGTAEKPETKAEKSAAPEKTSEPPAQSVTPDVPPTTPVPPERKPTPSPKIPAEEMKPGRGGTDHKKVQHLVKQWGDGMGYRSTIEKPILNGAGSVDVALEKGNRSIACLVSVTTGKKWELGSVRKSLSAGFGFVVLVAADEKHLAKLRQPIEAELSAEEKQKVRFFTPDELFAFIQEQDVAEMEKERTVRGYKVKSNYRPVGGADNSERQEKISKVIAKSIKRGKKKNSG